MQKIYQIIQIIQTLGVLIAEIRALCVQNAFRYVFGIVFYFTPQLNPFHFVDAYKAATQDKAFIFSCTKAHNGEQPENAGQEPPQTDKLAAEAEAPKDDNGTSSNNAPEPPAACGCAE